MKLQEWLTMKGMSKVHFAGIIGVSPGLITHFCKGRTWPSRDVAQRIMTATKGRVTPNDFLGPVE